MNKVIRCQTKIKLSTLGFVPFGWNFIHETLFVATYILWYKSEETLTFLGGFSSTFWAIVCFFSSLIFFKHLRIFPWTFIVNDKLLFDPDVSLTHQRFAPRRPQVTVNLNRLFAIAKAGGFVSAAGGARFSSRGDAAGFSFSIHSSHLSVNWHERPDLGGNCIFFFIPFYWTFEKLFLLVLNVCLYLLNVLFLLKLILNICMPEYVKEHTGSLLPPPPFFDMTTFFFLFFLFTYKSDLKVCFHPKWYFW